MILQAPTDGVERKQALILWCRSLLAFPQTCLIVLIYFEIRTTRVQIVFNTFSFIALSSEYGPQTPAYASTQYSRKFLQAHIFPWKILNINNMTQLLLLGKFEYTGGPIFKVVLEC